MVLPLATCWWLLINWWVCFPIPAITCDSGDHGDFLPFSYLLVASDQLVGLLFRFRRSRRFFAFSYLLVASDQLVGLLFRIPAITRDSGDPEHTFSHRVEIACKYHKRLSYGYLLSTTGVLQRWPDKAIPTASAGVLAFERRTPEPLPACGNLTGTHQKS